MRTAFIRQLIEEARTREDIFLVVGDLGFSVVEPFAEMFPERFLNAGIAEQNMAGVAAGLAMTGYRVFVYSIANFPTLRCMEQIRNDICYHGLNVKIVSVGAGFAYGSLGMSHHATEDVGMMRTLPGMYVLSPGDPAETMMITKMLCAMDGPAYLRLGKAGEKMVAGYDFSMDWGGLRCVKKGKGTAVVCHGSIITEAIGWLNGSRSGWSLYSMPFINCTCRDELVKLFNGYDRIVVVEEHRITGGLGSCLLETLYHYKERQWISILPEFILKGITGEFPSVAGSREYLRQIMNLLPDDLK